MQELKKLRKTPLFTSLNYEQLLKLGNNELLEKGSPSLPAPPMLMLDNIKEISFVGGEFEQGFMEGSLKIDPSQWFFKCHFKHDPVMPGCLGLDGLWQMLGIFLGMKGCKGNARALGAKDIKFSREILGAERIIIYKINIKKFVVLKSLILVVADGMVCDKKGDKIYQALDLKVGVY